MAQSTRLEGQCFDVDRDAKMAEQNQELNGTVRSQYGDKREKAETCIGRRAQRSREQKRWLVMADAGEEVVSGWNAIRAQPSC